MQETQLRYVIKVVADMDKAVKFHRDVLGLKLKFESPGWSEFLTGETTLALHPASDKNPAGKVELGFTVADVEASYRDMSAKGVLFSMPPKKQDFGGPNGVEESAPIMAAPDSAVLVRANQRIWV
jgi:catechol 2,3-dioxygenase-like lactoylglutathione lyase family enzyme